MKETWRRLSMFSRRRRLDAELEEELRFHLDMAAAEHQQSGMSPEEARYAARRQFGNTLRVRETAREFWGWRQLDELVGDIRLSLRMLARRRTLTLTALISLALGIGGAVAVYTIIHSVLLRPLPYRDPDRLVTVWASLPDHPAAEVPPLSDYAAWRERNSFFEEMAALLLKAEINLTGDGPPEWLEGQKATSNLFPLLGVQPELGRSFLPGDETGGAAPVAIISHGLWQRRFNGDVRVLGKIIGIDGVGHEVIGVMPEGFGIPDPRAEVWTPFDLRPAAVRDSPYHVRVLARLKPGTSVPSARAMMTALAAQSAPETWKDRDKLRGDAVALREMLVGPVRERLVPLGGAVAFLLLIACANVAGLLLAAGAERSSESALRSALGAGRGRLIRQHLAESMVLALAGCAAGLALASFLVDPLIALSPAEMPRRAEIHVDRTVVLFAIGLSLLAGAFFGAVPALAGSRPELIGWLQSAGRRATSSRSRQRVRRLLVSAQIAVALALCTGAGLMIRSFQRLLAVDVGFDPGRVLTFQVRLPESEYASEITDGTREAGWSLVSPRAPSRFQQILEELRAIPGVESASAISWLPMNTFYYEARLFSIVGRPRPAPGEPRPGAGYNPVDADFFRTLSVPLIRGRLFNRQDHGNSPWVAIINETLARTWFPNQDPIGQQVNYEDFGDARPRQIVGVVKDLRQVRLNRAPQSQIYFPFTQLPPENHTNRIRSRLRMGFLVRTDGDIARMAPLLRQAVNDVDKALPVFAVQPMNRYVVESARDTRFLAVLMGALAGAALLLAAVGLYGMMSHAAVQRTQEIGIRVALGARQADMVRMVLRQALRVGLSGLAAGLLLAVALTRFLESALFGVRAVDPPTLAAVCAILAAVALGASYIPARRASRVDPVTALRNE